MGESRVGAPLVLDTFDVRQVGMGPFRLRFRGSEVPGFRGSGSGVQRFTGSAPLHRRTAKPAPRMAGSSEPEPGNPRTSEPEPRHPGTPEPRNLFAFTLRRLRLPFVVRVLVEHGMPVRVMASASAMPNGRVVMSAGPWRSSGGWWSLDRTAWDRDEWDVQLDTGVICRLARHRATGTWEIEGVFD